MEFCCGCGWSKSRKLKVIIDHLGQHKNAIQPNLPRVYDEILTCDV